jgi:hypothetical protein
MSFAFDNGPGKYDGPCQAARVKAGAEGCVLIVFNGQKGTGFSVQGTERVIQALPAVLREVAASIDEQLAASSGSGAGDQFPA